MRNILMILVLAGISLGCDGQKKGTKGEIDEVMTSYYFIRHAEKELSDPTNRNPNLTPEGESRAVRWKDYFADKEIEAVYSTNYLRTMRTAEPTARANGLEIIKYDPRDLFNEAFKEATKGKNVVVVGHSNTTPDFANKAVGNTYTFKEIDESEYYHLYKVSLLERDGKIKTEGVSVVVD